MLTILHTVTTKQGPHLTCILCLMIRQQLVNSPTHSTAMPDTPTMNFQVDLLVQMDTHLTMCQQQQKDTQLRLHPTEHQATTSALILVTENAQLKIVVDSFAFKLLISFQIVA